MINKIRKSRIVEIEKIKCNEKFYDIQTSVGNYIANGIVVHNSRPHKKSAASGVYMPHILKESVRGVFHIDTSGSMSEEDLRQALSELQAIMDGFNNVNIEVLIGDAELQSSFTLTSHNKEDIIEIASNMKGGGGTDHQYIFPYITENLPEVKFLVCFTDAYTTFPKEETYPFQTLWLLTKQSADESTIPFGQVLKITRDDD